MTFSPDPKPEFRKGNSRRRVEDTDAIRRAKIRHPHCAACGKYGGNGHHVLPKDRFGDDVEENIVVLCGSGTSGCHGAHHGSPYVVPVATTPLVPPPSPITVRRDAEWVNRKVGEHLYYARPDVIEYILGKLGEERGTVFLQDTYYLTIPTPQEAA